MSEEIQNLNQALAIFFDGLADQLLARTDVVMRASILRPLPGQTVVIPDGAPFDTMVWRLRGSSTSEPAKFNALTVAHDGRCYLLSSDHEINAADELEKLQMMADYISAGADGAKLFNCQLINSRPYQNNVAPFQNIGLGQDDEKLLKTLLALNGEQRQQLLLTLAQKMNPPTAEKSIDLGGLPISAGKNNVLILLGHIPSQDLDGDRILETIYLRLQRLDPPQDKKIMVGFYHDFSDPEESAEITQTLAAARAQDLLQSIEAGLPLKHVHELHARDALPIIKKLPPGVKAQIESLINAEPLAQLDFLAKHLPKIEAEDPLILCAKQIRQQDWPMCTTRQAPDCLVIYLGGVDVYENGATAHWNQFLGIDSFGRCAGLMLPAGNQIGPPAIRASMDGLLKFLSGLGEKPTGLYVYASEDFSEKICGWAKVDGQPGREAAVRSILGMNDKARRGVVFHLVDFALNGERPLPSSPATRLRSEERAR